MTHLYILLWISSSYIKSLLLRRIIIFWRKCNSGDLFMMVNVPLLTQRSSQKEYLETWSSLHFTLGNEPSYFLCNLGLEKALS